MPATSEPFTILMVYDTQAVIIRSEWLICSPSPCWPAHCARPHRWSGCDSDQWGDAALPRRGHSAGRRRHRSAVLPNACRIFPGVLLCNQCLPEGQHGETHTAGGTHWLTFGTCTKGQGSGFAAGQGHKSKAVDGQMRKSILVKLRCCPTLRHLGPSTNLATASARNAENGIASLTLLKSQMVLGQTTFVPCVALAL